MKTQEKKTTKQDIFLLLKKFEKSIKHKPSLGTMIKEIAMMGFKIKKILGDFSSVNLSNKKIIELLWSLGKFEDFFQKKVGDLSQVEQEILLQYFNYLKEKLIFSIPIHQTLRFEKPLKDFLTNIFEIEILRSQTNPKKVN